MIPWKEFISRPLCCRSPRTSTGRLVPFQNGKMLAPQQKEPIMETIALTTTTREPWNEGKLVARKTPYKLKEIWAIRVR
jgi:hypothetical protein